MSFHIMIADNHSIVREGLKKLFELEPDFHVAAEAKDMEECLSLLLKQKLEILILDINMPDPFHILKEIHKNVQNVKILILTENNQNYIFCKAMEIGVDGYMLKNSSFEELKKALFSIIQGKQYISPFFLSTLKQQNLYKKNDAEKIKSLTKRELDVLKNLARGMYNKEIAIKLEISERTVKNHISSIFKKVSVADRTQAAVFAIRNNLIDIYC